MRYNLHFRIFHPKKVLGPPYGFSVFGGLYLSPCMSPHENFFTFRLNSTSSFD
uniref:Uncharacterized protein n=1 Tax=Meloidogyne enterolobii TaxID=390850 RepID=A0A6V7VQQ5_MELEN|nr:unnamed protein product [Meloidogyne enterolobii]